MKKLEMVFKSSDDKTKTFTLGYASQNLSEEVVTQQMKAIADLKLFDRNGVNPYATPLAAKYVDTVTQEIFDTRK